MRPLVSAVLVTYNSAETLAECLKCMDASLAGRGHEVIVVDNASSDDSCQVAESASPDGVLIRSGRNLGFAAGVNLGARHASGEILCLVNPDLFLNRDCVSALTAYLNSEDRVAAVGPKLVYPDGRRQPSCRRYPTFRGVVASQIRDSRLNVGTRALGRYLMEDVTFDTECEVEWLIGACMMIPIRAWRDIGGLDERFFLYREDTDWCIRARARGWKVIYHPGAEAVHCYRRASTGVGHAFIWHLMSMLRFYRKHGFRF